jgi:sulfide:quinone oxidoreductase
MTKIVVVGAGIGGCPMAFELRDMFGKEAEIVVVSDSDWFYFVPSNPWVALKWRKPEEIRVDLRGVFQKLGIRFSSVGVNRVVPAENKILLKDGSEESYDYLVIATGPKLAFDEIEGFGPDQHTISICHTDHALLASEKWEEFCKNPGPLVIGAVQGASCFGPAYEFALMAVTDLRRRKIRDRVPLTFVTSEPYIGHLGLGGVGDTKGLLESLFRDRDIKWITNAKVDKITAEGLDVTEMGEDGNPVRQHSVPAKLKMMLPAFRGVDCLKGEDGQWIPNLTNPRGFVSVNKHQYNATYPNIFAVGVCIAIPPLEKTPVPTGVPKTGFMIESMVTAVTHNIHDIVNGKPPVTEPTWNAVCLADFGDSGVAFVAQPQIPPRNVNWSSHGYWVHLGKLAFEKYFLRKVRTGNSEPFYERLIMKILGIGKLRDKILGHH